MSGLDKLMRPQTNNASCTKYSESYKYVTCVTFKDVLCLSDMMIRSMIKSRWTGVLLLV